MFQSHNNKKYITEKNVISRENKISLKHVEELYIQLKTLMNSLVDYNQHHTKIKGKRNFLFELISSLIQQRVNVTAYF